jgi:signal transduction histidine kinase
MKSKTIYLEKNPGCRLHRRLNRFGWSYVELIDEMQKEFIGGNKEEGIAIASDIKKNIEKIIHHGKRADAIVKGMMQHSRANTGTKEVTDINALAQEYLQVCYHDLRSKNKSLNVKIETHFNDKIQNVNIIPQDIGRVLLNLYNNAFYAINEKKKQQAQEV